MSEINIVVVDDEEMLAVFIKDFLQCYGYSVEAFTDASQAFNKIESDVGDIDLLITDQSMPNMSGLELIEKVRNINSNLPIILYSGFNDVEFKGNLENYNISYCFQKPVDNSQLLSSVKQLLS